MICRSALKRSFITEEKVAPNREEHAAGDSRRGSADTQAHSRSRLVGVRPFGSTYGPLPEMERSSSIVSIACLASGPKWSRDVSSL